MAVETNFSVFFEKYINFVNKINAHPYLSDKLNTIFSIKIPGATERIYLLKVSKSVSFPFFAKVIVSLLEFQAVVAEIREIGELWDTEHKIANMEVMKGLVGNLVRLLHEEMAKAYIDKQDEIEDDSLARTKFDTLRELQTWISEQQHTPENQNLFLTFIRYFDCFLQLTKEERETNLPEGEKEPNQE